MGYQAIFKVEKSVPSVTDLAALVELLGPKIILLWVTIKFSPAVTHHFCLNFPVTFLQPCAGQKNETYPLEMGQRAQLTALTWAANSALNSIS